MHTHSRTASIVVATLAILTMVGCHISSHGKDGKEDVDIRTPLGGLAVKTDPTVVLGKIGLPAYPGAVPVSDEGSDKNSADVNLSFGSFRLRVLSLGFRTSDDRDKVEAFYRKALQQYSDVIACHDQSPIGQPSRTDLGLTCSDERHVHVELNGADAKQAEQPEMALKAGSPKRQHLVTLRTRQDGTHFSLIALDLPNTD